MMTCVSVRITYRGMWADGKEKEKRVIGLTTRITWYGQFLLEQSCDEVHFFLSSACSVELCERRIDRPQPAVIVPKRENARLTMGEDGTLFGRGASISGTCRKLELFVRWPGTWGEISFGAGRASNSATGTCGDPNPDWMPYSISYKKPWKESS